MSRPPPADSRNLQRAVVASVIVHAVLGLIGRCGMGPREERTGSTSLVDIDIAPQAPLAERLPDEIARLRELTENVAPDETVTEPEPEPEPEEVASTEVDARVDARPKRRPDAAEEEIEVAVADAAMPDASMAVAMGDAGAAGGDAVAVAVANVDWETGSGAGSGSGSGSAGAIGTGSGSGSAGAVFTGDEVADAGEPGTGAGGTITAGTAANLLAYFPKKHVVTAVIRFDRVRGSRWQGPVDKLFKHMPDHITLIPEDKGLGDLFDTVVISSPKPGDAIATTLVVRYRMSRPELREMLDEPDTPVTWSATTGGLFGLRGTGARTQKDDKRNFLSPYLGWLVLSQPADYPQRRAGKGDLDTAVATVKLPAWMAGIRAIEDETGTPDGPTLVLTMAPTDKRFDVPDLGLDIKTVPAPTRITVALQFVKQGFLVRGNLRFASEADAIELVDSVTRARERILDSTVLKAVLTRARALNGVKGLTMVRTGLRVSYATSVSVSDADGLLAAAAQYLEAWFHEAADRQRGGGKADDPEP